MHVNRRRINACAECTCRQSTSIRRHHRQQHHWASIIVSTKSGGQTARFCRKRARARAYFRVNDTNGGKNRCNVPPFFVHVYTIAWWTCAIRIHAHTHTRVYELANHTHKSTQINTYKIHNTHSTTHSHTIAHEWVREVIEVAHARNVAVRVITISTITLIELWQNCGSEATCHIVCALFTVNRTLVGRWRQASNDSHSDNHY